VAFLCRRYKVSKSGFYAWAGRDGSKGLRNDQSLGARIERIHHDSGGRYGSPRVHEVLRREGIRCSNKRVARLMRELGLRARVPSMNRPRNCQDNAHMESFFHSLKAELTHQRSFLSDSELNASVAGYINRFYNEKRIHSSLGYHSPVEFECLAHAQQSVHQIG